MWMGEPSIAGVADCAAAEGQALRGEQPMRGHVRPLLPLGGQLHRGRQQVGCHIFTVSSQCALYELQRKLLAVAAWDSSARAQALPSSKWTPQRHVL